MKLFEKNFEKAELDEILNLRDSTKKADELNKRWSQLSHRNVDRLKLLTFSLVICMILAFFTCKTSYANPKISPPEVTGNNPHTMFDNPLLHQGTNGTQIDPENDIEKKEDRLAPMHNHQSQSQSQMQTPDPIRINSERNEPNAIPQIPRIVSSGVVNLGYVGHFVCMMNPKDDCSWAVDQVRQTRRAVEQATS